MCKIIFPKNNFSLTILQKQNGGSAASNSAGSGLFGCVKGNNHYYLTTCNT